MCQLLYKDQSTTLHLHYIPVEGSHITCNDLMFLLSISYSQYPMNMCSLLTSLRNDMVTANDEMLDCFT